MKVYLDNVIVSGMVRGDPPDEMAAVRALVKAEEKGQIEIYTSRWTWSEQDRTRDDLIRVKLKESRGEIEVVADDHQVLGFWNQEGRFGTEVTNPMVTEIVDEGLFSDLKKAGLSDGDARHLMYAIHNKCDRFVTLDTSDDILPKRSHVVPLCRGTKIVTPSELAAELSAS
jgi:predicted nucleic acid-binding protein